MNKVSRRIERVSSKGGRPTREQVEAIERAILAVAREAFLSRGFERTTVDGIAKAARVSKVTIYMRYSDKVALLRAVLDERLRSWSKAASEADWMLGDTLEQRLQHYGWSILSWIRNPEVRAFRKLIEGSFGEAQEVAEEMQARIQAPMLEQLGREFVEYCNRADMTIEDGKKIARLFLGMLFAISEMPGHPSQAEDKLLEADIRNLVDVLIRGQAAW